MIVASRMLYVVDDATRTPVPITIFAPVTADRSWQCDYTIGWPDHLRASAGYGADGVQALIITLQKIAIELYMSPYHQARTLVFEQAGEGYGFPMGKDFRDLLVGKDAEWDGN